MVQGILSGGYCPGDIYLVDIVLEPWTILYRIPNELKSQLQNDNIDKPRNLMTSFDTKQLKVDGWNIANIREH